MALKTLMLFFWNRLSAVMSATCPCSSSDKGGTASERIPLTHGTARQPCGFSCVQSHELLGVKAFDCLSSQTRSAVQILGERHQSTN
jgi:hypothetical protein